MSNPLLPLMYGPAGRALVVDASGRLVFNGDSGADQYVFGYGSTGRSIAIDASGRLLLSPDSINVLPGGASSLQDAYDGGDTINVANGPIIITGGSGVDIQGDNWSINSSGVLTVTSTIVTQPPYVVYDSGPIGHGEDARELLHGQGSNWDFVLCEGRTNGLISAAAGTTVSNGPFSFYNMGSIKTTHRTGYDELYNDYIRMNSADDDRIMNIVDWKKANSLYGNIGDITFKMIKVPPTAQKYDSGFVSISTNSFHDFHHNLGSEPTLVICEMAESSAGSGWRVPQMSSTWSNGTSWQAGICKIQSSGIRVRTKAHLCSFRDYGGTAVIKDTGYCRIFATTWQPDYQTSWTQINKDELKNQIVHHDFGSIPSIAFLEIAENSDGTGWRTVAMNGVITSYNEGTTIIKINERNVWIKGGSAYIARLYDEDDSVQNATTGYFRLSLWR